MIEHEHKLKGSSDLNSLMDYQNACIRTIGDLTKDELLVNCALGLAGEAGEVIDHIKKHLYQGHDLDKDKIAEELGDLMWYIAVMAISIDYALGDIANNNIDKLLKRYPEGFDTEKSKHRQEESNGL